MPLRNVATNYTFEQQRQEINLLAADVDTLDTNLTSVSSDVTALQGLQATETTDSPTFANLTLTGYLAGPATLTIDPAAVGDNTGTVVIAGNLQVDGVTTTVNSTTMTVDDLAITVASGAANAAAADAAGIDVDGAGATFYYRSTPDAWASNKKLLVNQTSEQATRANLEVTSTKDASFPQYSYGIMATDDAAYNVNPGSGIGFGYKWNASGNYAQAGGIRMIKENTNDNDYAGAMLFYTRPMGDGPLERLRVDSAGRVTIKNGGSNVASEFNNSANQLVITNNGNCGLTIDSTSTTSGSIHFADGATGAESYQGIIEYNHNSNYMSFATAGTHHYQIVNTGAFLPVNDNTVNLGSATKRFANIYSADLQLSNEGMGNDVDGTWGQYTIQEGEDDLYLLNRRNGKTYKFVLQEVQ